MSKAEAIILVPGLFGFANIAGVDYFASVKDTLTRATGVGDILSLDTPPTGSLWRRVDTLHRAVREKIAAGATKVHLVGHSTGGLDARLLTTPRYLWPGGPSGGDRTSFFKRMGAVVAISAPQKGTPLARRLRGANENAIPFLFLVSILAKRKTLDGANEPRSKHFGGAVSEYLRRIVDDRPLLQELTPYAMERLNQKLLGEGQPRAEEPLPLTSFVTVAPPPRAHLEDVLRLGTLAPLQRALYTAAYVEARVGPNELGSFPEGRWVDGVAPGGLGQFAPTAQDGVVPAASQTLDGRARGLVFADHLDVVGNYRGARRDGQTVFDSGAKFDDARMEALWLSVADVIAEARSVEKAA